MRRSLLQPGHKCWPGNLTQGFAQSGGIQKEAHLLRVCRSSGGVLLTVRYNRVHDVKKGIFVWQPSFDFADMPWCVFDGCYLSYRATPARDDKALMLKNNSTDKITEFTLKFCCRYRVVHTASVQPKGQLVNRSLRPINSADYRNDVRKHSECKGHFQAHGRRGHAGLQGVAMNQ